MNEGTDFLILPSISSRDIPRFSDCSTSLRVAIEGSRSYRSLRNAEGPLHATPKGLSADSGKCFLLYVTITSDLDRTAAARTCLSLTSLCMAAVNALYPSSTHAEGNAMRSCASLCFA